MSAAPPPEKLESPSAATAMAEDGTKVLYEGRDLEALADMPNYYAWITGAFRLHVRGVTIEYGAGTGTVSRLLRPLCDSMILVEPSPNLAVKLQRTFNADRNVVISDQLLETHIRAIPDASVDTVVMVNVLEHIEDDDAALEHLARILKPGGCLLLFVPALPVLMSDLDRQFGHFRRYLLTPLRAQLTGSGLTVRTSHYFDFVGIAPWFLFNTLLGSTRLSPGMLKIYDRMIVPVSRRIECVFRPPLGKNILAVARKAG